MAKILVIEQDNSYVDTTDNVVQFSFEKIFPPQNKQEVEMTDASTVTSMRNKFNDNITNEKLEAYNQVTKYFSLLSGKSILSLDSNSELVLLKVKLQSEEEMSMECFNALLKYSGNPDYIIVPNYIIYEHFPSDGTPKDIPTSEGIVETWEINNTMILYMPPVNNMGVDDILLWRKILTEILV